MLACVEYKDHCDPIVAGSKDFTHSVSEIKETIDKWTAIGGGDHPEAIAEGLYAALNLSWRFGATKILVLCADAPPHGVGSSGDSYPNGSPNGYDPLLIGRELAQKEVLMYTVCFGGREGRGGEGRKEEKRREEKRREEKRRERKEKRKKKRKERKNLIPILQVGVNHPDTHTVTFLCTLSRMSGGRYLPLAQANNLPSILMGGAEEEVELAKFEKMMDEEEEIVLKEAKERGEVVGEEEVSMRVASNLKRKRVMVSQLKVAHSGGGEKWQQQEVFLLLLLLLLFNTMHNPTLKPKKHLLFPLPNTPSSYTQTNTQTGLSFPTS